MFAVDVRVILNACCGRQNPVKSLPFIYTNRKVMVQYDRVLDGGIGFVPTTGTECHASSHIQFVISGRLSLINT